TRERHTYQVLTKRPERMARFFTKPGLLAEVASQGAQRCKDADNVHDAISNGPWPLPNVWLGTSIESDKHVSRADHLRNTPAAVRFISAEPLLRPLPNLDLSGIDWLIVGGESGPGSRPMSPQWVRDLRDRCAESGTAFFFKQWGGRTPKANGCELDGRTWDEYPGGG
ncbi:MAG TPA: DUF5131 family protein, partial [Micromonosporaceae bacterium]